MNDNYPTFVKEWKLSIILSENAAKLWFSVMFMCPWVYVSRSEKKAKNLPCHVGEIGTKLKLTWNQEPCNIYIYTVYSVFTVYLGESTKYKFGVKFCFAQIVTETFTAKFLPPNFFFAKFVSSYFGFLFIYMYI